ncbi:O-antigen ligase [Mycolicibacterium sp. BK634]|nr:O-antigen ligase [Mycolicibacterium sp. BK634]
MARNQSADNGTQPAFIAAPPRSAGGNPGPSPTGPNALGTFLSAPVRGIDAAASGLRAGNRAYVVLLATAMSLVVIPEVINHLILKHTPDLEIERALISAEAPIAGLSRWAFSGLLLVVAGVIAFMPGHPNRDITWLGLLLLALNLPYVIGPEPVLPPDLIKIVLANVVLVAIWNTGARVAELKWIPILVTCVGVYSIIGGLLIPEYMMYNLVSRKSLVAGWELAGPFGQSNALGMYCGVAFSLVPLIPGNRWRVICASILFTTIVLSATRTAVTASAVVMLWWTLCWLRTMVSVRLAGTVLASLALSAALVVPLLDLSPETFTGRAFIWSQALDFWQHSPFVGSGFNWFLAYGQSAAELVIWAGPGTGHNILIDTLVKSGLAGVAALLPIWIGAIVAVRAIRLRNEQIAVFGYLIAFFVIATTEAVWDLWPNMQQFPTSGLIFATLLMARGKDRATEGQT